MIINPEDIDNANILIPKEPHMELISFWDYVQFAELSILMTKNDQYVNAFGMVTDRNHQGFFMQTDNNRFRIMLGNEFQPSIYRGQNFDYDDFLPSFKRPDVQNNEVNRCVEWIKCEEFKDVFRKTPYYTRLSQMSVQGCTFDFDLDAIAQHYEFSTNYLDVTNDINTAMFFAYTFINEQGNYVPITDFKTHHPTLYVANFASLSATNPNAFKIVGFQSGQRPQNQFAMAINMEIAQNDIKKHFFRQIDLPQSSDVSLGVFNSFKGGFNLFPDEPLAFLEQKIKANKKLSKNIFDKYCVKYGKDAKLLEKSLIDCGFSLTTDEYELNEAIINDINVEITQKILPWIKNNIAYRRVSRSIDDDNPKTYYDISASRTKP